MRWVTFSDSGSASVGASGSASVSNPGGAAASPGERVGVLAGESIHALPPGVTLLGLIERGADGLRAAGEEALRSPSAVLPLAETTLLAPIPRPPSIRDCLCYLDHMRNCLAATGRDPVLGDTWYRIPAFYFACPTTVFGPHQDVPMAPGTAWQDFELEVAAVIGVTGSDLTVEAAERAIIGYMIYNDWSARDLQQLEGQLAIGQAKGKDSGITLGPYLVTPDELEPYRRDGKLSMHATAIVDDMIVGMGSTSAMDWTFAEVISYASRGVRLVPGDVFGSGTVPSCTLVEHLGTPGTFPGWLRDGDVVTLQVQGLGEIRQRVVATPPPAPLAERPRPVQDRARVNPAASASPVPYTRGLHQVGDRVWAWTLPDGGYGWNNAGLIVGGDGADTADATALLVDTLFDLPLTREMLTAMAPITDRAPIKDLVITHADGDHTHGAQLLGAARLIAAAATADDLGERPDPSAMVALQVGDFGPVGTRYLRDRFGQFDFGGITHRVADQTFDRELTVDVGGRQIRLIDLGPAHTAGDCVVHVPDAGVLFTGDLVFSGCTPIVWSGPIGNWVAACDAMAALNPTTVVPGHGPVTDVNGIYAVRDYLVYISEQADRAYRGGMDYSEAANRIDLGEYAGWLDAERVLVNVYQRYRELDPGLPEVPRRELLIGQAQWLRRRSGDHPPS